MERQGAAFSITSSIGGATLHYDTRDTPQELLQAAEQALLVAKRAKGTAARWRTDRARLWRIAAIRVVSRRALSPP
jgi:GGDEF domain-containing protein